MKTNFFKVAAMAILISIVATSCGSNKPAPITKVNEEIEILVPCGEFFTDANFFRGQGVTQSRDLNTAREKARMAANVELASSMTVWIKQLSEKYVNDAGQSPADYEEIYESLTKQKVDQQMSNVSVVCNKVTKTTDNMYKVYMAVEVDRKKVFESYDKSFAEDKKLKTLYDREKFRAIYDAEMESFKNSK